MDLSAPKTSRPVDGATVAAYDSQGTWRQDLGFTQTNEKGYFSLVIEKLSGKAEPVVMGISKDKQMLAARKTELSPVAGATNRVEILIGKSGGVPPPIIDPKIDPKVDPKVDPRVDPKVDLKVDPKVDLKVDPKIDPKVDPKSILKLIRR